MLTSQVACLHSSLTSSTFPTASSVCSSARLCDFAMYTPPFLFEKKKIKNKKTAAGEGGVLRGVAGVLIDHALRSRRDTKPRVPSY